MTLEGEERRVQEALTAWFLAQDRGEAPDLAALCGHDERLAARVRRLIDDEPLPLRRLSDSALEASALPTLEGLPVPAVLGDFRLLRLLGSGGMASVFLARQETLGRRVALKVLERSVVRDER